jgi:hypothetical protein
LSGGLRARGNRTTFAFVYLLFLLAFGIGYIAITPPFEGFDETAHYSSVRQIADTGEIPVLGKSFIDQSVIDYQGPMRYDTGTPPFDRGLVYPKFFARPELVTHYLQAYRQPEPHVAYRPSTHSNWQAQHPPLYYVLLAQVLPWLDGLSFTAQFFVLRLISFALAVGGVAFGLAAVDRAGLAPERDPEVIGYALYPIVLPMFFPAFARIGNDSLCLLLAGVAAWLLASWLKDERDPIRAIAIGVVLGLGLLTKAFFLPITVGLGIFLAIRLWLGRRAPSVGERFRNSAFLLLAALAVGGGWYVYKLVTYGDLTGAEDSVQLARQGGMLAGFERHFSIFQLVRGALMPLISYQWMGTWSVTRVPEVYQVPMVALAGWIAIMYARQLGRTSLSDPAWLPVWMFGLFLAGLLWHTVTYIALYGLGSTGGWYLHILMPWVAPALGLGIASIVGNRGPRLALILLLAYAFAFHVFVLWAQMALFTGCATKGSDKYYVFSGKALCFDQASLVMDRLAVIAYPTLALIGFAVGLACLAWLLVLVGRGLTEAGAASSRAVAA